MKLPDVSASERTTIALSSITAAHPEIEKIRHELDVPPLTPPASQDLDKDQLLVMLRMTPIPVSRHSGGYYCVGSFRMWYLCRLGMPADEYIPVVVIGGRNCVRLFKCNYLAELFYLHAIYGLTSRDVEKLFHVLSRMGLSDWPSLYSSKAAYARAMNISGARLRS